MQSDPLRATPENQSSMHRGKVLFVASKANTGSNGSDSRACKVDVFHRGYLPPLVFGRVGENHR